MYGNIWQADKQEKFETNANIIIQIIPFTSHSAQNEPEGFSSSTSSLSFSLS